MLFRFETKAIQICDWGQKLRPTLAPVQPPVKISEGMGTMSDCTFVLEVLIEVDRISVSVSFLAPKLVFKKFSFGLVSFSVLVVTEHTVVVWSGSD